MRVISGIYRGRRLVAPAGRGTRPTTDRVRESLMSTIASARGGWDDAIVLDAFAGSGALAIEALSRGARWACLCEQDRAALQAIKENTAFITDDSFQIVRGDVLGRIIVHPPTPYDIVFLDPPYALDARLLATLLQHLEAAEQLADDALIAYEHDAGRSYAELTRLETLSLATSKVYGDTVVDLFRRTI